VAVKVLKKFLVYLNLTNKKWIFHSDNIPIKTNNKGENTPEEEKSVTKF